MKALNDERVNQIRIRVYSLFVWMWSWITIILRSWCIQLNLQNGQRSPVESYDTSLFYRLDTLERWSIIMCSLTLISSLYRSLWSCPYLFCVTLQRPESNHHCRQLILLAYASFRVLIRFLILFTDHSLRFFTKPATESLTITLANNFVLDQLIVETIFKILI